MIVPISAARTTVVPGERAATIAAAYARLFKFRYHLSYGSVVLGAVIFANPLSIDLAGSLIALYFLFNVLLYGGIYTLNDVADLQSDRQHPTKRRRPIASGQIPVGAAVFFAATAIVLGVAGAVAVFGERMAWMFAAFLALNAGYSAAARNVAVLDLVGNSATHPLRFLMGASLVGGDAPAGHVAVIFAMAIGLSSLRRFIEMDVSGWRARVTLRRYSRRQLIAVTLGALVAIVALCVNDGLASPGFYLAVLPTYVIVVAGALASRRARGLLVALWTR